jgi:hypothetical protein
MIRYSSVGGFSGQDRFLASDRIVFLSIERCNRKHECNPSDTKTFRASQLSSDDFNDDDELLDNQSGNGSEMAELSLSRRTNGDGSVPAARRSVRQCPLRRPRVALAARHLRVRRAVQRWQNNFLEQRQKRAHGSGQ